MKISRILFGLMVAVHLTCTGCFCTPHKRCSDRYSRTNGGYSAPYGCTECSSYGPEMFGTPTSGNAMLQAPGQAVDERLGAPAKQTPYEGPAKK